MIENKIKQAFFYQPTAASAFVDQSYFKFVPPNSSVPKNAPALAKNMSAAAAGTASIHAAAANQVGVSIFFHFKLVVLFSVL